MCVFQGKVKAKDLRGKKKDELLKQLEEQKQVVITFSACGLCRDV